MLVIVKMQLTRSSTTVETRVNQHGGRGHQVARKNLVGRPLACSKNNISMINVFTFTNINTKIIECKLSKIYISEVCNKQEALRIDRFTRSILQFQKVWSLLNALGS